MTARLKNIGDSQQELIEEFQFFDNWIDRYQYIIDMGRQLPEFPEHEKIETNRLRGCQSQVWLITHQDNGRLVFQATSDSAIVAGLIAVLMRVYSERTPQEILQTPPDFIAAIGLDQHLSPTRSNGLNSMVKAIQSAADACG